MKSTPNSSARQNVAKKLKNAVAFSAAALVSAAIGGQVDAAVLTWSGDTLTISNGGTADTVAVHNHTTLTAAQIDIINGTGGKVNPVTTGNQQFITSTGNFLHTLNVTGIGAYTIESFGQTNASGDAYGAIATEGNFKLSNTGTSLTFSGNKATGTALVAGGAISSLGTITIDSGTNIFTSNEAKSTSVTPDEGGYGGALAAVSDITITGGANTFTTNKASHDGGAIFSDGTVSINGASTKATFTGNEAGGDAGAIHAAAVNLAGTATSGVKSIVFDGNTAAKGGGAIVVYSQVAQSANNVINNVEFKNNEATAGDGGAVYIGDLHANTTNTISNSVFTSNEAGKSGGAIYTRSALAVTNSTFSGNEAGVLGGAIWADDALTVSGSTFTKNTAIDAGGAIFAQGRWGNSNVLTLTNTTFGSATDPLLGNSVTNLLGGASGGAFMAYGDVDNAANYGDVTLTGVNIYNSTATAAAVTGGGAAIAGVNNFTFTGGGTSTVKGNKAIGNSNTAGSVQVGGGGLYLRSIANTIGISGVTFDTNSVVNAGTAVAAGGALMIDNIGLTPQPTITLANNTFKDNSVTSAGYAQGGAVWTNSALAITGGSFTDNSAKSTGAATTAQGGAIFATGTSGSAALTLTDTSFSGNTALSGTTVGPPEFAQGGAIWTDSALTIKASSGNVNFTGNTTKSADGTASVNNDIHLAGAAAIATFDAAGKNITLGGGISGTGSVVKTGTGTLTFESGSVNTYTGATTINAGTLKIAEGAKFGSTGAVMVDGTSSSGATLEIQEGAQFTALPSGLTLDDGGKLAVTKGTSGSGKVHSPLSIALTGTGGVIDTASGIDLIIGPAMLVPAGGVISDVGALTKTGAGNLTLYAANTYSGGTKFNEGTLTIANDAALGASSGALTVGANGLKLAKFAPDPFDAKAYTVGNAITLGANTLTIENTDTVNALTLGGVISGTGGGLTKTGAGNITLSNVNTYTGATTVNTGTLALSGTGSVAMSSGVSLAGTSKFDISGTTSGATVKALSGITGTSVVLGGKTLTIGDASNSASSFAGVIGGTGGIVKAGAGTLTLSGNSTYTGTTAVNAGTLTLSGSLGTTGTHTGNVTVASGSQLAITSTGRLYGGNLTVAGTYTDAGGAVIDLSGLAQFANNTTINSTNFKSVGVDATGKSLTLADGAKVNAQGGDITASEITLGLLAELKGDDLTVGKYTDTKTSEITLTGVANFTSATSPITINSIFTAPTITATGKSLTFEDGAKVTTGSIAASSLTITARAAAANASIHSDGTNKTLNLGGVDTLYLKTNGAEDSTIAVNGTADRFYANGFTTITGPTAIDTSLINPLFTYTAGAVNSGKFSITRNSAVHALPLLSQSVALSVDSYSGAGNPFLNAAIGASSAEVATQSIELAYNAAGAAGTAHHTMSSLSLWNGIMDQVYAGNTGLMSTPIANGSFRGQARGQMPSFAPMSGMQRSVWVMPVYGHQSTGDLHSGGVKYQYTSDQYAVALGGEAGYGSMRFGLGGHLGGGKTTSPRKNGVRTESDSTFGGLAGYTSIPLGYAVLNSQFGWIGVNNRLKQSTVGGNIDATVDGGVTFVSLGLEKPFAFGRMVLTPLVGFEYDYVYQSGFKTKFNGAGVFDASAANANVVTFPVGLKAGYNYAYNGGVFTPEVRARVLPVAGDRYLDYKNTPVGAQLATMRNIVVDGVAGDANLGFTWRRGPWSSGLNYGAQFSENFTNQSVSFMLQRTF